MQTFQNRILKRPWSMVTCCSNLGIIKKHSMPRKQYFAAATVENNQGGVIFFKDEGEKCADCVVNKPSSITNIQWHPNKALLAIAWESGEVGVWNQFDKQLHETSREHKNKVTVLEWSSQGTRLISADESGLINVWKVDAKGRVQQAPVVTHKVENAITQCILQPIMENENDALDIRDLAKAAVSGDERALDLLSYKGMKGVKLTGYGPTESMTFLLGCADGQLLCLTEHNDLRVIGNVEGAVVHLLYYSPKAILVTVTDTGMLSQHLLSGLVEGSAKEIMKVKLAGRSSSPQVVWAGDGILAMAMGENLVRMWDILKEDNYVLQLEETMDYDTSSKINALAYSEKKRVLAAGTSQGQIAFWRFTPRKASPEASNDPEEQWQLQSPAALGGNVSHMMWGTEKDLLAVNVTSDVFVMSEHYLSSYYNDGVAVVQTGPYQLFVGLFNSNIHSDLKVDVQIRGVCTTRELLAFWNGKRVIVNEFSADKDSIVRNIGTFNCSSPIVLMHEQNIYTIENLKIQVRNAQGTVKQLLNLTESEGSVISMDICGNYLAAGTDKGCVRLYDLSRREAKPMGKGKFMAEVIPGFSKIHAVSCNCTGTYVSISVLDEGGEIDPMLYIWDLELDSVQFFNFQTGRGEQMRLRKSQQRSRGRKARSRQDWDDMVADARSNGGGDGLSLADRGKNEAAKDISGRFPAKHSWDSLEARLVVVEARLKASDVSEEEKRRKNMSHFALFKMLPDEVDCMVVSLFATQESGILMQDSFPMHSSHSYLMSVDVPYYYFGVRMDLAKKPLTDLIGRDGLDNSVSAGRINENRFVARRTMRDFIGLEEADRASKEAMMNFSYFLTIGNMDEAFKAMKLIKSESVWYNMAKMCVKTRRIDVATVCLGKMGDAKGAMMLREARAKEVEIDAQVAILAMQLGMLEESEHLLKSCKRYDLLNQLYQGLGHWGKAVDIAETYDRIHLRSTFYNFAKHLESRGDINGAIEYYMKSETHRFEVPRMLFEQPDRLEQFVMQHHDPALRKWWAQYMESSGALETAVKFYETASDFLSLVRVHCFLGQIDRAAEICNDTGDRVACYHLARQFETTDNVNEAIHFFTRAQAYSSAIRLCKDNGRDDHLVNLALLGKPEDMVEAAQYLESKVGYEDRAVMLYHKAGQVSRAVDLAFRTRQFQALQHISSDLNDKTDPQLLQKCADFFMSNNQFDRAVDLLANGKQFWEALKLCVQYNVPMTEDLAEKLTPVKKEGTTTGDSDSDRIKLLEGIAEVCINQRQYHLACKKYTQAGNRQLAMKALLKSGDTDKIIFFASVSKQKDIYVMAANYLQSLDWRRDPDIMKSIVQFYTRGRAMESLASFYEACSQVEIDEYKNYEKALGALGEAFKCLSKAKMPNENLQEHKLNLLKYKVTLVKRFVNAKRLYEESSDEAMKQCQALLEESDIESAVRVGDVYSFIIDHFVQKEKFKAAHACLEELKGRLKNNSSLTNFVSMKTIEMIHRALDIPLSTTLNGLHSNGPRRSPEEEDDGEEEVEEEIVHDN